MNATSLILPIIVFVAVVVIVNLINRRRGLRPRTDTGAPAMPLNPTRVVLAVVAVIIFEYLILFPVSGKGFVAPDKTFWLSAGFLVVLLAVRLVTTRHRP